MTGYKRGHCGSRRRSRGSGVLAMIAVLVIGMVVATASPATRAVGEALHTVIVVCAAAMALAAAAGIGWLAVVIGRRRTADRVPQGGPVRQPPADPLPQDVQGEQLPPRWPPEQWPGAVSVQELLRSPAPVTRDHGRDGSDLPSRG